MECSDPDGAGPCTAATDQMNITINNATGKCGTDQTSCGASSITFAANATTAVTDRWRWFICSDRNAAMLYSSSLEIGTTITLPECS
jgi:hypothetical protein